MWYLFLLLIPYFLGAIIFSGVWLHRNPDSIDGLVFWSSLIWPISTVLAVLWLLYRKGVLLVDTLYGERLNIHILPEPAQVAQEPPKEPIRAPAVIPGATLLPPLFEEESVEEEESEKEEIPAVGTSQRRGG